MFKQCPVCSNTFETFAHNKIYCSTTCRNKQMNAKVPREYARKLSRESYHRKKTDVKNMVYYLLRHAKARATKKHLVFELVSDDIIIPEKCPILNVKLIKGDRRYGPSLDRIDSLKGYTKDNIWVISQLANAMKWDSNRQERLAFANWVLSYEKEEPVNVN